MIKMCVVSFSPDQVGADGRVEEGEDGGESQIRSRCSCCQQAAKNQRCRFCVSGYHIQKRVAASSRNIFTVSPEGAGRSELRSLQQRQQKRDAFTAKLVGKDEQHGREGGVRRCVSAAGPKELANTDTISDVRKCDTRPCT